MENQQTTGYILTKIMKFGLDLIYIHGFVILFMHIIDIPKFFLTHL